MQQSSVHRFTHTSFSKSLLLLGFGLVLLDQSLVAQAQIISNGAGTLVNSQGNQINITGGTQAGANLFHSFRDFNVNSVQVANFLSNPQTQNILARVNEGNPSIINGLLQVTGGNSNLFLMNPSGIVFGQGASLNVPASFTATTANQIGLGNNQYFAATGNNNYASLTGNPDSFLFTTTQAGSIINAGNLAVGSGQNISLIAGNTINTGRLSAPGGEIQVLAVPGTNRVRLSQPGQVLSLEIVLPDSNELKAVDLPALLTGSDLPGIAVNPSGQVEVAGTSLPNQQGIAVASGRIDVSSSVGNGGIVQIMGDRVAALNSRINANGAMGGGTVRLGGEYLGGRDTGIAPEFRFNSQRTLVDRNSLIRANATVSGEGGRVIVWADQNTGYFGRITGRGATGQGAFVEVSGRDNLAFDGRVEIPGANGLLGTLLLDPTNITIQAAAGNGDGLLPNILVGDTPTNMTISAGALEAIPSATAINITASNNIDFQSSVNFTSGTGAITFTAANILSPVVPVALNTNGRNVTITADTVNGETLFISSSVIGANSGNIQVTANNGDLILGALQSIGYGGNAGSISLNALRGNIRTTNLLNSSGSGIANGGNITFSAPQGSITTGFIGTDTSTGNSGSVNFTSQGNIITRDINTNSVIGNAGTVSLNTLNGNILTEDISTNTGVGTGNGGAINLTANQGSIITGDVNSISTNRRSGNINILAQGNIRAEYVVSGSITNNGGNIRLASTQGNITTGGINSRGDGAGNASGTIDITAGNLFRVTGICGGPSICSDGQNGAANGAITIRHGGSTTTPFIVGNSAINGTEQRINAGVGNTILATTLIPVPPLTYTQGIVNIITTASPIVPPVVPPVVPPAVPLAVTPAAPPPIAPELLTLLRNPAPPATPAPVVVGTPSETMPIVELSIPAPIFPPVVVVPPVLAPEIVPTPVIPRVIPIPAPSASPNLPLELRTTLADLDPQDTRLEPEPPSGTLAFITNPSSTEIAARLRTLGNSENDLSAIQNNLNQIAANSDTKPAQIYVFFTPQNLASRNEDTLEIILITGRGEPRRVQLSGITRSQVLGALANLRSSNGSNETVNLSTARQFYQWLLAPLESELQQQGINNLVFILDEELNSLPLESLYDGQGFIRERFTISRP